MIKSNEIKKDLLKPSDVAKILGVSVRTVQEYTKQEKLEVIWTETGRRLIPKDSLIAYLDRVGLLLQEDNRYDVIYARVSTHRQEERGDLDRQVSLLTEFVITRNPKDLKIYKDVCSGFNDNRKNLNKILNEVQKDRIQRIFISCKDRLTRFGYNYIKAICDFHNTEIVIASDENTDKSIQEELAEDIISLIHSFIQRKNVRVEEKNKRGNQ